MKLTLCCSILFTSACLLTLQPRFCHASASLVLDQTFRPETPPDAHAVALAVDSQSRIVLALDDRRIIRLLPSGRMDPNFSPATVGVPDEGAHVISIAFQRDGRIIVRGWFSEINGISSQSIARLNADGSLDSAFQSIFVDAFRNEVVLRITPTSTDKLFIFSWPIGTTLKPRVLRRLHSDGTLDTGFEPIRATISAHCIGPSDEVVLRCFSPTEGRWTLSRYFANGERDTSFQSDPRLGEARSLFVREDRSILFYGDVAFDDAIGLGVAHLRDDGTLIECQPATCADWQFLSGNLAYLGSCSSDSLKSPTYYFAPIFSEFPEPAGAVIWPRPETKFFPIAQQRALYVAGGFTRPGNPNGPPLPNDWPLSRFLYTTDIQLHTPQHTPSGIVISAGGSKEQRHAIEASSDLQNWTVIGQASSIFQAIIDQ